MNVRANLESATKLLNAKTQPKNIKLNADDVKMLHSFIIPVCLAHLFNDRGLSYITSPISISVVHNMKIN